MMRQLEPAAFRAWLEAQPRSRCIGVARSDAGCPLARYLGDGGGDVGRGVVVDADEVSGRTYWVPLPAWAWRFVRLVDDLPSLGPHRRRIYPRLALALLDEALARPEPEAAA